MNKNKIYLSATILFLVTTAIYVFAKKAEVKDPRFVSCVIDCKKQNIKFYWKDDNEKIFRSIQNLKLWLENRNQKLEFAMNGGMYKPDNSAQGLFIQEQKILSTLDTANGTGNFYLKPNGIFYITTDNVSVICNTTKFAMSNKIKYATQSGPMLVIDGHIHSSFKEGSKNLNIRNGVGILPNNKIVFAMSKNEINFYDFANYFKSMGCKNALYLDGLVSRTYLPKENWIQTDGNFGVIIGVAEHAK